MSRRRFFFFLWTFSSVMCPWTMASATLPFKVIVNPTNPTETVSREALAQIFFKKTTIWPNSQRVLPVDLNSNSAVRRQFSEEVLHRSVIGMKSYWQQMIFSGQNIPPPELADEQAVIEYVKRVPGAVGYVSASADIGSLKTVQLK